MPELEQQIAAWRDKMKRAGITDAAVLDELASHLHEQTKQYIAGMDAESAFALAAERLGEPAAVRREFAKQQNGFSMPVVVTASLWISLNVVIAALILDNPRRVWDMSGYLRQTKLFIPVISLSGLASSSAVCASGFLAMWYVGMRWKENISGHGGRALVQAIAVFDGLIAVLSGVWILYGIISVKLATGKFVPEQLSGSMTVIWWVEEAVSLVTIGWFAGLFAGRRSWRSNPNLLMMLQFAGNLMLILSYMLSGAVWIFGMQLHFRSFWWPVNGPMTVLIALNVTFLLLAATLKKSERLSPVDSNESYEHRV